MERGEALRYMLSCIDVGSMSDQQPSDEKLQALALALLPLNKLDAGAAFARAAHKRGVDDHWRQFAGDLQYQPHDLSDGKSAASCEAAATHRNIEQGSVPRKSLAAESDRQLPFHALILAAILADAAIANAP